MKCQYCFVKDSPYECPANTLPHPVICRYADPNDSMYRPQYGKTVESICNRHQIEADYRDELVVAPTIMEKAFSFIKSFAKHIASINSLREVARDVSDEVYQERQDICNRCVFKSGENCSICGCKISLKAAWATESCPKGFWQSGNVPPRFQHKGCGCSSK